MQAAKFNLGPVALTSTLTTNIFNPGTTTGGTNCTSSPYGNLRVVLYHIRVVNKTASAAPVTLYRGATGANAAGTELAVAENVPANSHIDLYFPAGLIFDVADFLVGGSNANTTLVLSGSGEITITK